jgi:hypothetical protein
VIMLLCLTGSTYAQVVSALERVHELVSRAIGQSDVADHEIKHSLLFLRHLCPAGSRPRATVSARDTLEHSE